MIDPKETFDDIHRQHSERARTLSELLAKLILKRKGQLPRTFEELMTDYDIVKRCHEHVGACQSMNEARIALWPDKAPEAPQTISP